MRCPFKPCRAQVQYALVAQYPRPGQIFDEHNNQRQITEHVTGAGTANEAPWFGICPASYMTFPFTVDKRAALEEQEQRYRSMGEHYGREQEQAGPVEIPVSTTVGRPPRSDVPDEARWSGRDNDGEQGFSSSTVSAATTGSGSGGMSISETRAMIDGLKAAIGEAMGTARLASDRYDAVRDLAAGALDTSSMQNDVVAALHRATEQCDEAINRGAHSIEILETLAAGL